MKANEYQVGGGHYTSVYQHWDLVADVGWTYWEGCASKYVCRRKGNRQEDLEKAAHFLTKQIELMSKHGAGGTHKNERFLELFIVINQIPTEEAQILWNIFWASCCDDEEAAQQFYTVAIQQVHRLAHPEGDATGAYVSQ